jgi:sulfide dehydrogenase [flavocytochrome c] flavoprotein chain
VTLVEAKASYFAMPLSNAVIAGWRDPQRQRFDYARIAAAGIAIVPSQATTVDPAARRVSIEGGAALDYDRLVLAPGIEPRWDSLPGYDKEAAERMPHAWTGAGQVLLLRSQLQAMDDGGLFAISVPPHPMRCPPGPYERASLVAGYLKSSKPRSKVLVLDSNDDFPRQALFLAAWKSLYPGLIEWVPFSKGGQLASVDARKLVLSTDFDTYRCQVANVIPPQRAGAIALAAAVADRSGWCPVDPASFESTLQKNIHVIGDAVVGGALPKAASGAVSQAGACAAAIAALLDGRAPQPQDLAAACYSLAAPDYGIAIAGRFRSQEGLFSEIPGSREQAEASDPPDTRAKDAQRAVKWFEGITGEIFG